MSLFNKLLIAATVLGLLLPGPGIVLAGLAILPLSLSTFFSLIASRQKVRLETNGLKDGILYSYLFLSGTLLLSSLFMPAGMREGLVMYAIFPPAITVLVLSREWHGNTSRVLTFQLIAYSLSIVLVPTAAFLLLDGSIDATAILTQLILAFVVPGALSFFIETKNKELAANTSGVFLAALFYIMIAKSQPWIVANWATLLIYMVPLTALNAAVGYAVYRLTKDPDATLYALLKNGGAAATVSLGVLAPAAIAILSAKTLADVILILGFGRLWKKNNARMPGRLSGVS